MATQNQSLYSGNLSKDDPDYDSEEEFIDDTQFEDADDFVDDVDEEGRDENFSFTPNFVLPFQSIFFTAMPRLKNSQFVLCIGNYFR